MRATSPKTLHVAVSSVLLTALVTPFAVAGTGDSLHEGLRNATATAETEIIASMAATDGKGRLRAPVERPA